MARNKHVKQADKQRAARRDYRRDRHPASGAPQIVSTGPNPSDVVAKQELLNEFRTRFSPEEWQLAELRASGHTWPEIASVVGGNSDAARIRLHRAIDRVVRELGLDE